MTCKWLTTMVGKSPKDRLLDPFQMAFSWLIIGGDPNHVSESWDDPPSTLPTQDGHWWQISRFYLL